MAASNGCWVATGEGFEGQMDGRWPTQQRPRHLPRAARQRRDRGVICWRQFASVGVTSRQLASPLSLPISIGDTVASAITWQLQVSADRTSGPIGFDVAQTRIVARRRRLQTAVKNLKHTSCERQRNPRPGCGLTGVLSRGVRVATGRKPTLATAGTLPLRADKARLPRAASATELSPRVVEAPIPRRQERPQLRSGYTRERGDSQTSGGPGFDSPRLLNSGTPYPWNSHKSRNARPRRRAQLKTSPSSNVAKKPSSSASGVGRFGKSRLS